MILIKVYIKYLKMIDIILDNIDNYTVPQMKSFIFELRKVWDVWLPNRNLGKVKAETKANLLDCANRVRVFILSQIDKTEELKKELNARGV